MARNTTTTAKERVLDYLKEARCVCGPRYMAFRLRLSESTIRGAANRLVADGKVRRLKLWEDMGWNRRRAGYFAVYQIVSTTKGGK